MALGRPGAAPSRQLRSLHGSEAGQKFQRLKARRKPELRMGNYGHPHPIVVTNEVAGNNCSFLCDATESSLARSTSRSWSTRPMNVAAKLTKEAEREDPT